MIGSLQVIQFYEAGPAGGGIDAVRALYQFALFLVVAVIVAVIVLMLVRFVFNYADLNPFSRPVIYVRRLTDPFLQPVRRALLNLGISPNGAPLVAILLTILLGYFALMLVGGVLNTAAGVIYSVSSGRANGVPALFGYLLHGLLSLYSLLIFVRIISSWGRASHANRLMRWVARVTDPVLVPLRRSIPPLGMFDLSPVVAFLIIWLLQAAVAFTLLSGWRLNFLN